MNTNDNVTKRILKDQEEFFAKAVHELRTPLTAINGYSEALAAGTSSADEVVSFGKIIHRNTSYVLQLVDTLLDLAKLNSGQFDLEKEPFNLLSLCEEVENVCKPRAEEKGISFGIEEINTLSTEIVSDALRLKQVLLNLAINAVKFTTKGGVKIVIALDPDSDQLRLKIVDTGIGLTAKQQKGLFSAFAQGDMAITKEFGGTGLGLLVSKEIIDKMGGTLEVDSELGRGSVFSIVLPIEKNPLSNQETTLRKTRKWPPAQRVFPTLTGNVLVIEDDPDTASLVKYLLEKWGVDIIVAENGEKGLMLARKGDVDLILLDQSLPLMDGPTVASKLNAEGFDKPILAFSAERGLAEEKWIKDHGLAGAVPKPFRQSDLYGIVQNYLRTVSDALASGDPVYSSLLDQGREYRAIILKFVEGLSDRLEIIKSAMSVNDLETLASEAHKLGNAGAFGYPLLQKIANSLERSVGVLSSAELLIQLSELETVIDRVVKGAK